MRNFYSDMWKYISLFIFPFRGGVDLEIEDWRFLFFGNERNFSGVSCRVQRLIKGQKSKNPIIKKLCKVHKIKMLPLGTLHKNQKIQKNFNKSLDKSKKV